MLRPLTVSDEFDIVNDAVSLQDVYPLKMYSMTPLPFWPVAEGKKLL